MLKFIIKYANNSHYFLSNVDSFFLGFVLIFLLAYIGFVGEMAFEPILKLKVDELFLRWFTDEVTQDGLKRGLTLLKLNDRIAARREVGHISVPVLLVRATHFSEVWHFGTVSHSSSTSPRPLTPPHFPYAHRSPNDRQLQSPRRSSFHHSSKRPVSVSSSIFKFLLTSS